METRILPPLPPIPVSIPPVFDWRRLVWKPSPRKPETPATLALPALAKLSLTLESAGTLYMVLHEKTRPSARPKPPTAKPVEHLARLLQTLEIELHKLPAMASAGTILTLELPPRDAAYLCAMVANKKRDERRYELVRSRGVVSLDALMQQAEAVGEARTGVTVPVDSDRPERAFNQAEVKRALAALPDELAALLGPLEECAGNVSELARRLGRPQRKTARQVARVRKLLEKLGLGPV